MNLDIIASNLRLRHYFTEDIITLSNKLLEKGYFSDSLCKLVIEDNISRELAEKFFEKALVELGTIMPNEKQAIFCVLKESLTKIANNKIAPINGIENLVTVFLRKINLHNKSDKYLGDSLRIEKLLSAYYSIDDIKDGESSVSYDGLNGENALAKIEEDIIHLSKQWLKDNG